MCGTSDIFPVSQHQQSVALAHRYSATHPPPSRHHVRCRRQQASATPLSPSPAPPASMLLLCALANYHSFHPPPRTAKRKMRLSAWSLVMLPRSFVMSYRPLRLHPGIDTDRSLPSLALGYPDSRIYSDQAGMSVCLYTLPRMGRRFKGSLSSSIC